MVVTHTNGPEVAIEIEVLPVGVIPQTRAFGSHKHPVQT